MRTLTLALFALLVVPRLAAADPAACYYLDELGLPTRPWQDSGDGEYLCRSNVARLGEAPSAGLFYTASGDAGGRVKALELDLTVFVEAEAQAARLAVLPHIRALMLGLRLPDDPQSTKRAEAMGRALHDGRSGRWILGGATFSLAQTALKRGRRLILTIRP